MEKVVLSNGYEFELVANGINAHNNVLTVTFKPGEYTIDQMVDIWAGNDTITAKINETAVQIHTGYTVCNEVTVTPNYSISTKFVCPKCGAEVEPNATTCPECGAEFDAPDTVDERATVCTVKCGIPDINSRVADIEETVSDIVTSLLG